MIIHRITIKITETDERTIDCKGRTGNDIIPKEKPKEEEETKEVPNIQIAILKPLER